MKRKLKPTLKLLCARRMFIWRGARLKSVSVRACASIRPARGPMQKFEPTQPWEARKLYKINKKNKNGRRAQVLRNPGRSHGEAAVLHSLRQRARMCAPGPVRGPCNSSRLGPWRSWKLYKKHRNAKEAFSRTEAAVRPQGWSPCASGRCAFMRAPFAPPQTR